jgi:hypothetical protein
MSRCPEYSYGLRCSDNGFRDLNFGFDVTRNPSTVETKDRNMARKADARAKRNGQSLPFAGSMFRYTFYTRQKASTHPKIYWYKFYIEQNCTVLSVTYVATFVLTRMASSRNNFVEMDGKRFALPQPLHPKRHSFSIGAVKLQGVSRLGLSGIAFRVLRNIILTARYLAVFLTNPF